MNKETKFVRGYFDPNKFGGFKIKIHKDAIARINSGEWKPVGDYYNIEASQKKDGTGFYMKEDNWTPNQNLRSSTPVTQMPSYKPLIENTVDNSNDDLPF